MVSGPGMVLPRAFARADLGRTSWVSVVVVVVVVAVKVLRGVKEVCTSD